MKSAIRTRFRYLLRVLPNTKLNNFVILTLLFVRYNKRLPLPVNCRASELNDFIFWKCINNRWTPIERLCVDKEYAKIFSRDWGNVNSAKTIRIIRIDHATDIDCIVAQIQQYKGMRYVAKPTHRSGEILFLDEKYTLADVSNFVRLCLSSFFFRGRETQYDLLEKKIIIEENIDVIGRAIDYKFFCFNGKTAYCQVDVNRFSDHKRAIVDVETYSVLNVVSGYHQIPFGITKSSNFDLMLKIAEQLSARFEFVRIDLYEANGVVYFGEFTFTPGGALDYISNRQWARRVIQPVRARGNVQFADSGQLPFPR